MEHGDNLPGDSSGSGRKMFALAAVVVLLSVSIALSGWLIIGALSKIEGTDPFEANHTYSGDGDVTVGGVAYACTCTAESESISETVKYTVVSINVSYSCSAMTGTVLAEIMFDSDRVPVSGYTHAGTEGGYEEWQMNKDGVVFSFFLDDESIVQKLCVASDSVSLSLSMVS